MTTIYVSTEQSLQRIFNEIYNQLSSKLSETFISSKKDIDIGIKFVIIPNNNSEICIHYDIIYSTVKLNDFKGTQIQSFSRGIEIMPQMYVANNASKSIIDWPHELLLTCRTDNYKKEEREYGHFDHMDDIKQNREMYNCDHIITRKEKTLIDKFKFGFVYLNNINPKNDEIRDKRIKYLKSMKRHSSDLIDIELKQLKTKIFQVSDVIYKTKTFCFDYEEETVSDTLLMWISQFPIIIHKIDLTCQAPSKSSLRKGFTRFTKIFNH